ncbi:acyltransferase domain-containing protein [Streptomyces sp. NBC_01239]|uniref:acyltransferase domain-containing protein n=1 Tax=Streptomyces sp. NBC_01239 TaxID=2903792 RepID=UPI0022542710|nr:acyltransferase domain-containing protein [Streptomyces sp. NBC_01239]MCX4815313.1 acyltransferase domain-containing protein [Streptomyces sp. NBC_01239]
MTAAEERARLRRRIAERVAAWHNTPVDAVPLDRPLAELGMSSRDAVVLAGELSLLTGLDLPATVLWEAPTVDALVERVCGGGARSAGRAGPVGVAGAQNAGSGVASAVPSGDASAVLSGAAPAVASAVASAPGEPVAVIGVGCRLPGGVRGPADYWRLLLDGVDAIGRVPEDRWADFTAFPPPEMPLYGGYLDDIAGFDADFFRITPREAAVMDPQQRILLEVVRETLDHAAVPAPSLAGTATGIYVGVSAPEYGQLTGADAHAVDPWAPAGAALSVTAGRLAYVLDTRGPNMAVDTACSSSLVAVHQACVSLRTGETDTAIAAGVNVLLSPTIGVAFQRAGALAPDGHCKPFSTAADGIGRGEGCAAVLLKRLSDAERDGDRVLAVIRATAVNSDGRSNGLLAPNPAAQQGLLATAYSRAGLTPAHVDYVEAHGTGTPLGDPIEAGALGAVLGAGRDPEQPLLLGSVKGNLGHLESASGITGLVKTVLALHHDLVPPSLHGNTLADPHLRVVTEPEPWPRYGGTATAGISGFGFGGTNAHVVVEEWRPAVLPVAESADRAARPADEPAARLHLLSDVDTERVRDTASRLAAWLRTREGSVARPADVARTLAGRVGRGPVRAAVVARDGDELADALDTLAQGGGIPDARVMTGDRDRVGRGPVWVFSGYGSQWTGMGRQLLLDETAFASAVEKLDAQLSDAFGFSFHEHLATGGDLDRLDIAQPVLFGVQLALAELWRSYGVEPVAVIGHSLGEVAAAVCAGALDVVDAARVVAVRARLLSGLQGGAMAVVDVSDAELLALEGDFPGVQVAVHSSPRQKVVTGDEMAVARLVRRLEERGRAARVMRVVGAGHSPQVDPLLPQLTEALSDVTGRSPRIPVYSTVLEDPRGACEFDADHWAANLRRPVRLDRALAAAAADGHTAFVEISPHPVLARSITANVPGALTVGTLRRDAAGSAALLGKLGALYAAGLDLPFPGGRVIDLPAPRWRHVRYWWTDGRTPVAPAPATHRWTEPAPAAGDSVTARVSHHIATVTGHPAARVTPSTPLTDLGLDSLMAVRIRTAVERDFGVELHLRDLFDARTVEGVADRIRQLSSPSVPHRTLHIGGTHPPLFLFHAAGGTTDVYRALAQRLGDDRPVHGLDRVEDARTVSEKARRYAEAIGTLHPDGPCVLGGWSLGGFLAQETARQLTAAGRDIDLVVLIDSVRPLPRPDNIRTHLTGFAQHIADTYGAQLPLPYDELVALDDDHERIDLVLRTLREAVEVPPAALEHQRASYLDLRIGEAHRPGRYEGRVVLYRATEPAPHTVRDPAYERDDEALGWDEVCPRLTVVPVSGHHLSLLDPPHVDEIADQLRRLLAQLGGPAAPD